MKKAIGTWVVSIRNAYHEISIRNDVRATVLLVLFSFSVFWLFLSLESLLVRISGLLIGFVFETSIGSGLDVGWPDAFLQGLPSLVCSIVILWIIKKSYGSPRQHRVTTKEVPVEKHEGLVFLLGPYRVVGKPGDLTRKDVPESVDALMQWIDGNPDFEEVRTRLFATSWGPLWIAIEAHWPILKHVWLISTAGDDGSYLECKMAKSLILKFFAKKDSPNPLEVHFEKFIIENGYDIDKVVPVINLIYWREAPSLFVPVEELISDFTGGTKSMTAGMILATLDEKRKIQYLRQDKALFDRRGKKPRALTNTEISVNLALVMVQTSHALVPVSTGA